MKQMIWIGSAAMAGILLSGCGGSHPPHAAERTPAKQTAQLETLATQTWPEIYRATGTVQPKTRTVIAARVPGAIRALHVQLGSRVTAGQTLIELDDRDLSAIERQADAARQEARAAIPELESSIASARSGVKLAEITHRRVAELFEKKSITPQELDEANARLEHARAQLAMAESRRAQIQSRIDQTEQAYQAARIAHGFATITAPFAGLIVEKPAEPGMLASPGVPLLMLEQAGGYQLETPVEESRAPRIKPGQPVTVAWDDGGSIPARVGEVVPSMDPTTRTLTVKIPLSGRADLRGGQFARAEWRLGERDVLTVPVSAIHESGQLRMVCVVENGQARSRMITLGETLDGRAEVLSGLSPGERIVVNWTPTITDGTPVEARP